MKKAALVLLLAAAYGAGALTMWLVQRTRVSSTLASRSPVSSTRPAASASMPATLPSPFIDTLGIHFVRIEPGEFLMGASASEAGHGSWATQHHVKLTKPYWMATTEVTQAQWKAVMGSNPSNHQADDHPVEQVTWTEAVEFCNRLSAKEGKRYRLPTEAQWEYACRAGSGTEYYTGSGEAALRQAGWFNANSDNQTHAPAGKSPNAWGLYDMHGNVWEYCSDGYADLTGADAIDPVGDPNASEHVVKGGGWDNEAEMCRSANRGKLGPNSRLVDVGMRLCLEAR